MKMTHANLNIINHIRIVNRKLVKPVTIDFLGESDDGAQLLLVWSNV